MTNELKEALETIPTGVSLSYVRSEEDRNVAVFSFSQKGFGFGEISIVQTPEGTFIDTEYMSKEKVLEFFEILLNGAILGVDDDPKKHKLYNLVKGRICGDGCKGCA